MNFAFKGTPFSPWSRNSRYVIESFKLHHQSVSQSVLLSLVFLSFRRKNMVSVCLVLITKREDRKTESGAFGRLAQLERALHPLLIQFSPHIPHCSYPHKSGRKQMQFAGLPMIEQFLDNLPFPCRSIPKCLYLLKLG